MCLFGSQFSERLSVHGFATLSRFGACPASVRHMENSVVETTVDEPDSEIVEPLLVEPLLVEELLVEEISIDGMCGVY